LIEEINKFLCFKCLQPTKANYVLHQTIYTAKIMEKELSTGGIFGFLIVRQNQIL
jgi:hypothetical protein